MKRFGKAHKAMAKARARLPSSDREELDRFAVFLRDRATMSPADLVDKHGEYMGLRQPGADEALSPKV